MGGVKYNPITRITAGQVSSGAEGFHHILRQHKREDYAVALLRTWRALNNLHDTQHRARFMAKLGGDMATKGAEGELPYTYRFLIGTLNNHTGDILPRCAQEVFRQARTNPAMQGARIYAVLTQAGPRVVAQRVEELADYIEATYS